MKFSLQMLIAEQQSLKCSVNVTITCSVRSWHVSHSEFDLTVGKLSPILDD
jgi:hypothetical protein